MKSALVAWCIQRLVSFFAGLSADDFRKIQAWVGHAIESYRDQPGATKAAYVREKIAAAWPKMASWAVNLLLELAVARVKKGA